MTTKMPASLRAMLLGGFALFALVGAWSWKTTAFPGTNLRSIGLRPETVTTWSTAIRLCLRVGTGTTESSSRLFLLLLGRVLGLEDSRDVLLGYHLASHLFFLFAGLICSVLAYRVTGSRGLACLAMLVFVLHPRLYAHSFFNSKGVARLEHVHDRAFSRPQAFGKDTKFAFVVCGLGTGLLVNIRVMGAVFLVAVVGMRCIDYWRARDGGERVHAVATTGLYVLAAATASYATWPYLWADPAVRMAEAFAWALKSQELHNLFRATYCMWTTRRATMFQCGLERRLLRLLCC